MRVNRLSATAIGAQTPCWQPRKGRLSKSASHEEKDLDEMRRRCLKRCTLEFLAFPTPLLQLDSAIARLRFRVGPAPTFCSCQSPHSPTALRSVDNLAEARPWQRSKILAGITVLLFRQIQARLFNPSCVRLRIRTGRQGKCELCYSVRISEKSNCNRRPLRSS